MLRAVEKSRALLGKVVLRFGAAFARRPQGVDDVKDDERENG
jgi:hypothetical protein